MPRGWGMTGCRVVHVLTEWSRPMPPTARPATGALPRAESIGTPISIRSGTTTVTVRDVFALR